MSDSVGGLWDGLLVTIEISVGVLAIERSAPYTTPGGHPAWAGMRILRADPCIEVTAETVAAIVASQAISAQQNSKPLATLKGGVLTIIPTEGDPVIYREVAYRHERDTYVFCWPD